MGKESESKGGGGGEDFRNNALRPGRIYEGNHFSTMSSETAPKRHTRFVAQAERKSDSIKPSIYWGGCFKVLDFMLH